MSQTPTSGPFSFIRDFASNLRYPQLFTLAAVLFAVDLVVPDMVPFIDEILLGLLTVLLGRLKDRGAGKRDKEPSVKNVTPPR